MSHVQTRRHVCRAEQQRLHVFVFTPSVKYTLAEAVRSCAWRRFGVHVRVPSSDQEHIRPGLEHAAWGLFQEREATG